MVFRPEDLRGFRFEDWAGVWKKSFTRFVGRASPAVWLDLKLHRNGTRLLLEEKSAAVQKLFGLVSTFRLLFFYWGFWFLLRETPRLSSITPLADFILQAYPFT